MAAGLRLGLKLVESHRCPCGTVVTRDARHKLSCALSASGREARHEAINDLISRALRQADVANAREPAGLSTREDFRPDGVTTGSWSRGKRLIWDASVKDVFATSYRTVAKTPGAVAARGEAEKRTKYQKLLSELDFVPVALESSGVWSAAGKDWVREIGRRIAFRTGNKEARAFLMRRISIEVQRGNARIVDTNLPTRAP